MMASMKIFTHLEKRDLHLAVADARRLVTIGSASLVGPPLASRYAAGEARSGKHVFHKALK
jgi:hypothetical protein